MKIVVFGLTVSSSWGNGHATLWRGLIAALARRGHRVVFFEKDVPYYAGYHRDLHELRDGELIFYGEFGDALELARRHLADADVGMVTSYCPDGRAASDLVLSSSAAARVFYDLDTGVTLANLEAGQVPAYLPERGLGDFDLVLSYTGGRALEQLRTTLGARRVAPLYGHVDPAVHHPVDAVDQYRADLSYLGTYAADRQQALEKLFIQPAQQLAERRFLIGGAQYPADFPWTPNIYFVRHMPPPQHPHFFCSSRLTLNVTRKAMAEYGYCPSGRLFEAAACGAPVLTDWFEGLEAFFEPGCEVLVARSSGDAIAAIELSDAELRRVAEAARERTLSEHTSERRAQDFERAVAGALGARTAIDDAAALAAGRGG
ncbi:MAG TPA: glycosyltransferase [Phycisphaerales bacterium]|nr:glycosyltransferase [Phycisphaerales bacterium]